MDRMKKIWDKWMDDELDIQHKLLNLILLAAFAGGIFALFVSILFGNNFWGTVQIAILILLVGISLLISNVWNKPQLSAVFITVSANFVMLPIMYFYNGGIKSGMSAWIILGMIFSLLLLKGKLCFILYFLNALCMAGFLLLELWKPECVVPLKTPMANTIDNIQSIFVVTAIFGAIFKYQSWVYRKQQEDLQRQEKELRKTMEALQNANNAKTLFLANMTHEIRTPINTVLGMDEMILRETDSEDITDYAQNIQIASQALLSMVNDVLDFTKMESGKMKLIPIQYQLYFLLKDCYSIIYMRAEKKGIAFVVENNPDIPDKLLGDEVRVRQIIFNLLTNAVKYTRKGSVILSIDYEKTSESEILLKVAVKDTGIGISQENREKLFQSFQRVDEVKNRNIEGTGLGLAITKQLLDMMGGTIEISSIEEVGSEFVVSIPQQVVSPEPIGDFISRYEKSHVKKEKQQESFRAPNARILVVDDVIMNQQVMKLLLKRTEIQVDAVSGGKECLERIKQEKYDIIFMDHMMPEMDGLETFRRMKESKDHKNPDTPVIALTANVATGAKEKYDSKGFADTIFKPVDGTLLEKMLRKYLPEELVQDTQETVETEEEGFLDKLSFLDTEVGMKYAAGSEEMYRNILSSYVGEEFDQGMIRTFAQENWADYGIYVHGMKSASGTIGATGLFERAEKLEQAAKEKREIYVMRHHQEVINEYQQLVEKIKNVL